MLNARAYLHFMRFFSACSKCLIKVLVSFGSRYIVSPIDMLYMLTGFNVLTSSSELLYRHIDTNIYTLQNSKSKCVHFHQCYFYVFLRLLKNGST